ncbi:MAG TPA: TIGR03013 family PEP-CTERM/XrtA system glycosyltransferase [Magnetococcales bacterium]|nr:TIGR03013 family PEP-CTERM/XrtA system glycosyltransferase [Magnetococcales bacterium]
MIRIFKHFISRWSIFLLVAESLAGVLAVYVGVWIRFAGEAPEDYSHGPELLIRALFFALVMIMSMAATGRYQRVLDDGFSAEVLRVAVSFIIGMVALGLLFYVFPDIFIGRGTNGLAMTFAFVIFLTIRWFFYHYIIDIDVLKRKILVFGDGENARLVHNLVQSTPFGVSIVGCWSIPGQISAVPDEIIIDNSEDLSDWVARNDIDEIVLAMDAGFPTMYAKDILDCKSAGVKIVDLPGFFEREKHIINMDILTPEWWIHNSDGLDQGSRKEIFKKMFDVAVSLLLLAIVWPIMALTALAIFIESKGRGPVIYTQERVGYGGRVFKVMKFRSMRTNAEEDGIARWASRNDARVTRVGRFIRKSRIDELPQFINVLKGEMSLVGPRPERPAFVNVLKRKIPYYSERLRVKPGITGWAQVRFGYSASEDDAAEKLKFDLYYVKNHSLFLDMLVLIHSVEVVLFGSGASAPLNQEKKIP